MAKQKFLKTLLTTASLLAMTTSAGNVLAVDRTTTGTPAQTSDGTNFDGPPAAADKLIFGGSHVIQFDAAATYGNVDINGKDGTSLSVSEDSGIGTIEDSQASNPTKPLDLAFTVDKTFTIANTGGFLNDVTTGAGNETGKLVVKAGTVTGTVGADGGALAELSVAETAASTITGAVHAAAVKVAGAYTATFSDAVTGALSFTADGTAVMGAGLDGAATTTAGSGTGTLEVKAGTVTGNVGGVGALLKELSVSESGVSQITGTVHATDVKVAGANTATFNGLVTSTNGLSFTAAGTAIMNQDFAGAVAFAGNDGTVQLAAGKSLTGGATSAGAGTGGAGKIEFATSGVLGGAATAYGTADDKLTHVKFGSNADANQTLTLNAGSLHAAQALSAVAAASGSTNTGRAVTVAGNFDLGGGIAASVSGVTINDGISLTLDGGTVASAIEGSLNGSNERTSNLYISDDVTLSKPVSVIDVLNVEQGKTLSLSSSTDASINADSLVFGDAAAKLNIGLDFATQYNSPRVTLNDATANGYLAALANNLGFTFSGTFDNEFEPQIMLVNGLGDYVEADTPLKFTVSTGDGLKIYKLNFAAASGSNYLGKLKFYHEQDVTPTAVIDSSGETISLNGDAATAVSVIVTSTYNNKMFTASDGKAKVLNDLFANVSKSTSANPQVSGTVDPVMATVGSSIVTQIASVSNASEEVRAVVVERALKIVNDIAKSSVSAGRTTAASTNQAKAAVAPVSIRSVSTSVAASGDDAGAKVGVWFSGNFGLGKQNKYNEDDGFRSTSYSGVAGADTMLSDNLTAGFALMAAHSKLQFRDEKQGDETTTKSYGMTLYGSYDFNNGFMTYGNMGLVFGNTDNKRNSVNLNTNATEVIKYNSTPISMMLGANVAYKYDLADNMVLVPSAGLNFMRMTVNDYVEEGSDLQNMEYKTKDFNSVSGRVGFDLIGDIASSSSMKIKPNAHANLSYDFTGKLPEVRTSFVGSSAALPTSSTKPARLSGDIGVGVTLSNEKVEFSIDYNAKLSRKYVGHEGSLKVRFNF